MKEVPVLIAGGGPVGMTLAKTLASFGIECMLVEKNPSTTRHPKMDITNSRSMELFRKLGLSKHLRDVAVPETNNFDVSWITTGRSLSVCGQMGVITSASTSGARIGPPAASE